MPQIITLLTDFGTADGYAAEIKGVLSTLAPQATVIDISHDILPHDLDAGRLALARYWRRFPAGTVHFAVVDPGVGSARAALAVGSDGRFLVGPDNGLLSPALLAGSPQVVSLAIAPHAAPTFHARDVFAPAAAALATGRSIDTLGRDHPSPIVRRTPEPRRLDDGTIQGEILAIDRFGNAITNCLGSRGGTIEVAGQLLRVARTYADAASGAAIAVCGSSGLIEVAVRDGSAASTLGLKRGTVVLFRPTRG